MSYGFLFTMFIGKGQSLKTIRFVCRGSGMPCLNKYVEHSRHDIIFFSNSIFFDIIFFSNNDYSS